MRVFAKVVEQGSFARAGQALDISNAVVTRHVADLEEHLGTRLLNRTTRRLSLTETGHAYLERVLQILQEIDDAEAIASSDSKKPSGTLRIYSHIGFGQWQLAKLLPQYAKQYPDVILDVTLSERTVDLVEDGFDVGIFITDLQKFDGNMIARQLAKCEVLLCGSPDYVKRHGAPKSPEDVSKHACLNFSYEQLRHYWPIAAQGGKPVNIPVNNRMFSNSGDLLRHCALAGMGIMIRPSFTVGDDLSSGRMIRLLPHHLGRLSVVMVYPSRRLLSAKVRSFVDFMAGQFPHPDQDPWLTPPPNKKNGIRGSV
jgi:DNA-binding transcriptional LysR family regulator